MMKHLCACITLLLLLLACGNEKKSDSTSQDTYYEYNQPRGTYQVPESRPGSMEGLNNVSTMSPEEDAYEEGRALAEEDRRNGTRQHEGDNYDDDYDDDYDDGYGEEE